MSEVTKNCEITVSVNFSMSIGDYKVLYLCYLPMIGSDGMTLYEYLLTIGSLSQPFCFGEDIFSFTGMNSSSLNVARKRLEGIGLLSTFHKGNEDDANEAFFFKVVPPLSAKKFFNDSILTSLLTSYIGYKRFENVKNIFIKGEKISKDFKEETAKLGNVFDLAGLSFEQNEEDTGKIEDKRGKTTIDSFDEDAFKKELAKNGIPFSSIENDYSTIKSTLYFYGLSIEDTVKFILQATTSDNVFLKDKFVRLCKDRSSFLTDSFNDETSYPTYFGSSKNAEVFKQQDQYPTPTYVCARLNMSKLPDSILSDLQTFQDDFNFPRGVVNNIIDYCLLKNNNQLPALAYLEKVAMSVKGSNPKDAYGCSIILKEQNKKFKKKREKKIAYQTGMLDKINSYDNQEGNNIVKDDEDSNKDSNKIEEDNSENDNVELSEEEKEFAKKLLEGM